MGCVFGHFIDVKKANELILNLNHVDIIYSTKSLNELANLFSLCGTVIDKKGLTLRKEDESFYGRSRDIVTANVQESIIHIHSRILQSQFEKVPNAGFLDLKTIKIRHFSYVMLHEFGHIMWRLKTKRDHPIYVQMRKCFGPSSKEEFWDRLEIEAKPMEEQIKVKEDFANLFAEKFIQYAKGISNLESYTLPESIVEKMIEETKINGY